MRVLDVVESGLEKIFADLLRLNLPAGDVSRLLTDAGHLQLSMAYEDMLDRRWAEAQKF